MRLEYTSSFAFHSQRSFQFCKSSNLKQSSSISSGYPPIHTNSMKISNIIDATRQASTWRQNKSNLAFFDFNKINIKEAKYQSTKFSGNVIFELLALPTKVLSTYKRSMDGMDKQYNSHCWCRIKITNI